MTPLCCACHSGVNDSGVICIGDSRAIDYAVTCSLLSGVIDTSVTFTVESLTLLCISQRSQIFDEHFFKFMDSRDVGGLLIARIHSQFEARGFVGKYDQSSTKVRR
jgi:hypothetical protein